MKIKLSFIMILAVLSCSTEGHDRSPEDTFHGDSHLDQSDTPDSTQIRDISSNDITNSQQDSFNNQNDIDANLNDVDSETETHGPRCASVLECSCENGDPAYCCDETSYLAKCSLVNGWTSTGMLCNEQSFEPYENVACPWSPGWNPP